MKAELPADEALRIAALHSYNVLDTSPETNFDDLTLLAAQICQAPVALISLIDDKRQWFKSKIGLPVTEIPRDESFCTHTLLISDSILEIPDARLDTRFSDIPLVTSDPKVIFYAGVPLITQDNYAVGTLCVFDFTPRKLSKTQKLALQALGRQVLTVLELRKNLNQRKQAEKERDRLFNYALDLYCIVGFDGYFKQVNPAWQSSLGWSSEELLAKPYIEFIHPDDHEVTNDVVVTIKDGKNLLLFDNRYLCKDGSYRWLSWVAYPETEEGLIFAVARDVTSQKQAQEQFRLMVESTPNGLVMINKVGIITLANHQMVTLFGYTREELTGLSIDMLVPERFRASHSARRKGFFATPEVRAMGHGRDLFGQRKDGTEFQLEIGLSPLHTCEGVFVLAAVVDITERKKMQRVLEQFKYTLDQTVDCVFICNSENFRFEYVNEGAKQQVGYSEAELFEMTVPDIKPEYSLEKYQCLIQPLLDGNQDSLTFETVHKHKHGYEIPVEVTMQIVRQGELKPRLVAIVRDISDRKHAEQLLRTKNEELKSFAYTVSHDLKAPLREISGYAQELERRHQEGLSERAQFCIKQIITASHNLDCLIEDLLIYSRVDSETPTTTDIDLAVLVQGIMKDRNLVIAEQGIELLVNVPAIILKVWERGLHQVLTNLIDNAIKYSRNAKPPRLSISAETTENVCIIAVKDNGVGFDMKYHDRIFGLFNRLVRADEFEGTGAGLAIVSKLLNKLGGSIRAESEPEEGATFFVELPTTALRNPLS